MKIRNSFKWILIAIGILLVLCVAVAATFGGAGIAWVETELLATPTPLPTYTPYPTYTPALSPTPAIDCVALTDYASAMEEVMEEHSRHIDQWNRWMDRVNEGEVSPESAKDRLSEFDAELDDFRERARQTEPPRKAREAHDLFLQMLEEEERAIALLHGYHDTFDEAYRADANAVLAKSGRLRDNYLRELTDLYERCYDP